MTVDDRTSGHPDLTTQQAFWDWHWRNWERRKTINPWKERRHEEILAILRALPLNRARILDLGCGHGWFTGKLRPFGEITGIDLSEEGIGMARSRFPDVRFVAGNLYTYPLPTGHYDVLISQEVIDHVDDQPAFVDRAAELLKEGGYFIVSCANRFVMERLGTEEFEEQPVDHIADYLTLGELKALLAPRFRILQARTILPVAGQTGVFRFVHSYKLNTALGFLCSGRTLERVKAWAGFGYQLLVLAQRTHESVSLLIGLRTGSDVEDKDNPAGSADRQR